MFLDMPKISDGEYEIMKIIWKCSPIKSQDIIPLVNPENNWNEKTIKTMINRLLKKGVIGYEKEGKSYLYYPIIDESDYEKRENNSFLQKFYNGSVNAMLSHFISDKKFSREEINELKKLLDEREK